MLYSSATIAFIRVIFIKTHTSCMIQLVTRISCFVTDAWNQVLFVQKYIFVRNFFFHSERCWNLRQELVTVLLKARKGYILSKIRCINLNELKIAWKNMKSCPYLFKFPFKLNLNIKLFHRRHLFECIYT